MSRRSALGSWSDLSIRPSSPSCVAPRLTRLPPAACAASFQLASSRDELEVAATLLMVQRSAAAHALVQRITGEAIETLEKEGRQAERRQRRAQRLDIDYRNILIIGEDEGAGRARRARKPINYKELDEGAIEREAEEAEEQARKDAEEAQQRRAAQRAARAGRRAAVELAEDEDEEEEQWMKHEDDHRQKRRGEVIPVDDRDDSADSGEEDDDVVDETEERQAPLPKSSRPSKPGTGPLRAERKEEQAAQEPEIDAASPMFVESFPDPPDDRKDSRSGAVDRGPDPPEASLEITVHPPLPLAKAAPPPPEEKAPLVHHPPSRASAAVVG